MFQTRQIALGRANIYTQMLAALFFAVVTAACSQISFRLPFTPVPVTLQVMGVLLTGLVLGSRLGAISQMQYLLMGIAGMPVFSGFSGGPAAFAGPTGGYLIGFIAGAWAAGWVFERLNGRTAAAAWVAGIAGIAAIYIPGAIWLGALFGMCGQSPAEAVRNAWLLGIVPFIGIDAIKAIAASGLALGGRRGRGMIESFRQLR